MNVTARPVRSFTADTPAGGVVEQRLARVLELPLDPIRGQRVILPGVINAPLAVAHVVVQAAEAGVKWEPGFRAPRITVELEPEPPTALAAAFESGWKALNSAPASPAAVQTATMRACEVCGTEVHGGRTVTCSDRCGGADGRTGLERPGMPRCGRCWRRHYDG